MKGGGDGVGLCIGDGSVGVEQEEGKEGVWLCRRYSGGLHSMGDNGGDGVQLCIGEGASTGEDKGRRNEESDKVVKEVASIGMMSSEVSVEGEERRGKGEISIGENEGMVEASMAEAGVVEADVAEADVVEDGVAEAGVAEADDGEAHGIVVACNC